MKKLIPTDWNRYVNNKPSNFLVRSFFLDTVSNAYTKLLKKASLNEPVSILELGSGTGYTNLKLSQALPTKKIVLIDLNRHMLNISKQTLRPVNCEKIFINQNFLEFKLKEKFDLVHSQGVVEHFQGENQKKLFSLHMQLLKPGGYCIIFAPTPTITYRLLRKTAEMSKRWKYTDEVPIPKELLLQKVKQTGLEIVDTTYFWKYRWLSEVGVLAKKRQLN
jgi:cyclopropane fatty-acyl-phospholipid synthase-like methyltransferase